MKGAWVDLSSEVCNPELLGAGTKVWKFCVLQWGVTLGERCVVGTHTFIGQGATLGDDVRIMGQCYIPREITIGSRVFIGPGAIFSQDRYPEVNKPGHKEDVITIEDDVAVGAHATILSGVTLGKGCLVGAGAVVTKDVPPGMIAFGNPAKVVRSRWSK